MSFWTSELGALTGEGKDAFTRTFKTIPDGTTAIAKIERFYLAEHKGKRHFEIDWLITEGEFKGQHVFQKIHAFDVDAKKKHRALNMMMLLYKMYSLSPKSDAAPTDDDLKPFTGKMAGLKIQEWSMPKDDGTMMEGNFVSEVNPAAGFKCETGVKQEVVHSRSSVDSAFSRNAPEIGGTLDDLPF